MTMPVPTVRFSSRALLLGVSMLPRVKKGLSPTCSKPLTNCLPPGPLGRSGNPNLCGKGAANGFSATPIAKAFGEPSEIFRRIWVPLERSLDSHGVYLASKLAALEALRGGFTTVVDAGTRSEADVEAV